MIKSNASRRIRSCARATIATLAFACASGPALAHHAMGGKLVTTLGEGLLSGLAHPVIGLDHLAFLLAVGLAAGLAGGSLMVPLAFIAASTGGVLVHLAGVDLPKAELLVACTVLVAGLLLMAPRARSRGVLTGLALVAGILHGYAFGESIVGAEQGAILAYLIGLALIGLVVMSLASGLVRLLALEPETSTRRMRWAGAAVCLVGIYALIGATIGS